MLLEILFICIMYNWLNIFCQANLADNFRYKILRRSLVSKEEATQEQFSACFESLGCISTTDEWHDVIHRPKNLKPLDRITIKTQFILINVDNGSENALKYDTLSFKKGHVSLGDYKPCSKLMILIHDFTSNGYTGWVKHLAAAYLSKGFSNIVSVDWEGGAEPPYEQAVANARVVALEIVALINTARLKQNALNVHIIGHGVGAHIAGYVGSSIKIEKITGLDPTGPYFEHMPPVVRLDPTDAKFVEVLHTDAFNKRSQGTMQSFGHFDFFINGAQIQPQCNQSNAFPPFTKINRNTLQEGAILPACSHKRSFKYFIESVARNDCEFTGFKCSGYQQFLTGNCSFCTVNNKNNISCVNFGLVDYETKDNYSFYLNTQGSSPFCLVPYLVTIDVENFTKGTTKHTGHFEMIMLDAKGLMVNATPTNENLAMTYVNGKSYSVIFYGSSPKVCNVVEARLKWVHNFDVLCLGLCSKSIHVTQIKIKLLSNFQLCNSGETSLCPIDEKTEMADGSYVVFKNCADMPHTNKTNNSTSNACITTTVKSSNAINCVEPTPPTNIL